jgi:5-formyltetrahydrofolate cyclo-ligase
LTVVLDTRRPPGLPGPRGLKTPSRSSRRRHPPAEPRLILTQSNRKIALRDQMRLRRRLLAREFPHAAALAARALPIERLPPFEIVSAYQPQGAEMDPGPLILRLVSRGADLALPAAMDRNAPLIFRLARDDQPLTPDAFSILAPPASATAVTPQLVIAPVVAFDRNGGRLGQGAGLFDRTLASLRGAGTVFVIGLAFAGQEVDCATFDVHDQPLDAILTEKGYKEFQKDI